MTVLHRLGRRYAGALAAREFRLLCCGQAVSVLGDLHPPRPVAPCAPLLAP